MCVCAKIDIDSSFNWDDICLMTYVVILIVDTTEKYLLRRQIQVALKDYPFIRFSET